MDADRTTYPEHRHVPVARYGRFRIDRTWIRTNSMEMDEFENVPELVLEVDETSEFDLVACLTYGGAGLRRRLQAGEVIPQSEVHNLVASWIRRMREGGVASLARYRRRVGPPRGETEATPGDWYQAPYFRPPGKRMIHMRDALPRVEEALRELVKTETNAAG